MISAKQSLWLRNFVVLLLVLGICFRLYNLDRKVFWYDETMTALRVSGNTQTTLIDQFFDGQVRSVDELLKQYQAPNPTRSLRDTVQALQGNPEHSPLYYVLVRFWQQLFGSSIAAIRSLSVLFGLLTLPCAYWLGMELFGKPTVSWAFMAIVAISPFHVLYAQEAREYSLWTLTILLSSATLLRALRQNQIPDWGLYGAAVALGLYTHPFTGFVAIGHGMYVLAIEKFRWTKRVTGYFLASIGGILLFLPWFLIVIQNFSQFLGNTASVNLNREGFLPLYWGLNLSRIFFDVNQGSSPLNPLLYIFLGLTVYALNYLRRRTSFAIWMFVIALIGVAGLALIAPDVLLGGRRSSIPRYAIPSFLGIQLAIAYLFTNHLMGEPIALRSWKWWRNGAIALAFFGIVSCSVSSQIPVWWHKSYAKSRYNPPTAEIINQSDRPLVVSDQIPGEILAFAHLLRSDVQLQLVTKPDIPEIPDRAGTVFLFKPSRRLQQGLRQQGWKLQPAYEDDWIWTARK